MATPKPLRVLILTYIFTDGDPRYGGEGRVVWESTHALARAGAKVFVVTSMRTVAGPVHPNITVYTVPFAKKDFLNYNAGELLKHWLFSIPLIFWHRIQVVHHLPTCGPDPFARYKFGTTFAMSADALWEYDHPTFGADLRLDNTTKDIAAGYTKPRRDLSSRIALRVFKMLGVDHMYPHGVDVYFARSEGLAKKLKESHKEALVHYTPNGADPRTFRPGVTPLYPKQGGTRFMHVGSVSRRKGVHHLLRGFLQHAANHPTSELYIVGRGEPKFVEELKELAKGVPQVRFIADAPDDVLPQVYASADVFCLVPLSGSTPTVLAEALATGLPILATGECGSGEAIEKYGAGIVVPPADAPALASAMDRFINPEVHKGYAAAALAAAAHFTWDTIATTLLLGYREAIAKKHG